MSARRPKELSTLLLFIFAHCHGQTDATDAEIVMYSVNSGSVGNLGGRSGADALCNSGKPDALSHLAQVHAFLSVSSSDTIKDMPENYNVHAGATIRGPNGNAIASHWDDLLDGAILTSLQSAGVENVTGFIDVVRWWSGSEPDGLLTTDHCIGWTQNAAGSGSEGLGRYGRLDKIDSQWIEAYSSSCNVTNNFLCVAY